MILTSTVFQYALWIDTFIFLIQKKSEGNCWIGVSDLNLFLVLLEGSYIFIKIQD